MEKRSSLLQKEPGLRASIERERAPERTAIARTEGEIALMQEYRTLLSVDIVTGTLDMREAPAKLPDMAAKSGLEPVPDDVAGESDAENQPE